MKKSQKWMIGFLPLIVIGGWFFPVLGYLVLAFMAVLFVMSFFSRRLWCWNFCPRGAFLDSVMPGFSRKKPLPAWALRPAFRGFVFLIFMAIFIFRIVSVGGRPVAVGFVCVTACAVTTIIAMILAVATKPRGWCMICPMGSLQDAVAHLRRSGGRPVSGPKDKGR